MAAELSARKREFTLANLCTEECTESLNLCKMCGLCRKEGEQYIYATFIKPKAKSGKRKVKKEGGSSLPPCVLPTAQVASEETFQLNYDHSIMSYLRDAPVNEVDSGSKYAHFVFVQIVKEGVESASIEPEIDCFLQSSFNEVEKYFILRIFPKSSQDKDSNSSLLDWWHVLRFLFHTLTNDSTLPPQPPLTFAAVETLLKLEDQKIRLILCSDDENDLSLLQNSMTAILANVVVVSSLLI